MSTGHPDMKDEHKISEEVYSDIIETLDVLETLNSQTSRQNRHIEQEISNVVMPLLMSEGFQVETEVQAKGPGRGRLDLKAFRDGESVICEYKFRKNGSLIGVDVVHQLLGSANLEN